MNRRFWLSDKTVRKFEELPIYCQRQNCSPGILVSSKVRFMWIFAGVYARQGASNESGVVVNGDFRFFRSIYLLNLHIQGRNNYIVLCSPLYSDSSLTPKRMTLNDLEWSFCVKIWSELGIQWAGVLAFGENCSEICRAIQGGPKK